MERGRPRDPGSSCSPILLWTETRRAEDTRALARRLISPTAPRDNGFVDRT
jgi:hypothetical protein